MTKKSQARIDKRFEEAYRMASETKKKFPPDIMLMFYAYYKQATEQAGIYNFSTNNPDVRNAFKLNALLQVKGINVPEAKKKYIALVEKHIGPLGE